MGKSKKEKRQAYFFDNKALLALILPLVVESFWRYWLEWRIPS